MFCQGAVRTSHKNPCLAVVYSNHCQEGSENNQEESEWEGLEDENSEEEEEEETDQEEDGEKKWN